MSSLSLNTNTHVQKTRTRKRTPTLGKRESEALRQRVLDLSRSLPELPPARERKADAGPQFPGGTMRYTLSFISAGGEFTVGRLRLDGDEVLQYFYNRRGFVTQVTIPSPLLASLGIEQNTDRQASKPGRAAPAIISKIPFQKEDLDIIPDETLRSRGVDTDMLDWKTPWLEQPMVAESIHRLYNDNRFETLRKLGLDWKTLTNTPLFEILTKKWYRQTIRMLNAGKRYDIGIWTDYMSMLEKNHRDTSNPAVYLPEDLDKAHRAIVVRLNRIEERERRKARQEADREYLGTLTDNDRAVYRRKMERFSSIILKDEHYTVSPLPEIDDHFNESIRLQHCLFHNHYYEKNGTIVVKVTRNAAPDKSFADAEIDFRTGEILQLYGMLNCLLPPEEDQAVKTLIRANIKRYLNAGKRSSARKLLAVETFIPAACRTTRPQS